jgi:diguanylate cyclase (GGDEF)-like protein
VTVTVSIGIAGYPNQGHDLETVLERADHAMYASKNGGKNRITLYSA